MNVVAILDKLGPKLSPWYIRNEKLLTAMVAILGILSGIIALIRAIVDFRM